MTKRLCVLILTTIVTTVVFLIKVPHEFRPWVLYVACLFLGLLFFDSKIEREATEVNHILFLILMCSLFFVVNATSADEFWRISAGVILLMSLLNESKSKEWALGSQLRSYAVTISPACLVLVSTSLDLFTTDGRAILSLVGLMFFSIPLIFTSLREGREKDASASAVALATCGTLVMFGAQFVIQDIKGANTMINDGALVGLPIFGLLLSAFSLLILEKNKRRNLFYGAAIILLIWSALTLEKTRFAAAFSLLLFLVWHSGLPTSTKDKSKDIFSLFSEYSRWAMPGSAAFTALVIILLPTEILNLQIGIILWLSAFVLFWVGTGAQENTNKIETDGQWEWKGYVALGVTFVGGVGLLGVDRFPQFLEQCERVIQLCISNF